MKKFRFSVLITVILSSIIITLADSGVVLNYKNGDIKFISSDEINYIEFLPDVDFISSKSITIISSIADGNIQVCEGDYKYFLNKNNNSNYKGNISSPILIVNGDNLSFNLEDQNYHSSGGELLFDNVQGKLENSDLQISNANFLLINCFDREEDEYGYYIDTTAIGGYTFSPDYDNPWETIASYDLGAQYKVNTFQKDTFYKGLTTISFEIDGEKTECDYDFTTYRVILKKEESSDYSADMIIYSCKFSNSPNAPTIIAMLLSGLKVEFGTDDITLTGNGITPALAEGTVFTPITNYTINNFNFKTSNKFYTQAIIDYQMMTVNQTTGANVHFEGSYINSQFDLNY